MIVKDWTRSAAEAIQLEAPDLCEASADVWEASIRTIAAIIREHCPFLPDTAYQPVAAGRMMIDPVRARMYCLGLTAGMISERIDRDRAPYLVRYFLGGWNPYTKRPGPALFLHHFLNSDAGEALHSHPWAWSASIILVGGYRETRCTGPGSTSRRDYLPGDINVIEPDARHRIDLLEGDAWTLFLAGPFQQAWQFGPDCGAFQW